jgi:hypothetical protein
MKHCSYVQRFHSTNSIPYYFWDSYFRSLLVTTFRWTISFPKIFRGWCLYELLSQGSIQLTCPSPGQDSSETFLIVCKKLIILSSSVCRTIYHKIGPQCQLFDQLTLLRELNQHNTVECATSLGY